MMFHENCLLADDSLLHERRFSCNIIPYFCRKLGKMAQNLSSAAVVFGALRVRQKKTSACFRLHEILK